MRINAITTKRAFTYVAALISAATLLVIPCLPTPVYAAASLTLNPVSGTVGSTIQVIGKEFSGRLATIKWDDKTVASNIAISDTGEFYYNLTVPPTYKGTHTLRVTDNSNWSASSATAEFTVVPLVTVFPTWARENAEITITGYGFGSSEKDIKITWDDVPVPNPPIVADKNGTWSIMFTIPKTTKGEHYIGASSSATNASEIGKTKFIVAPYLKVTPLSGTVGTQLLMYGWGFRANEDGLSITWDGELVEYNIRAELDGSMIVDGSKVPHLSSAYTGDTRASFFIPPTPKGRHALGVYGSSFTPRGVFNDVIIEVIPDIKLKVEPHIEGVQVTVAGAGFASNETVTVTLDKTAKSTTVTADKVGSFDTMIVVPVGKIRDHIITASGNKGNSAQATFSISSDIARTIPPEIEFKLVSPPQGTTLATFDSVGDVLLGTINYLFGVFDYLKGAKAKVSTSPKLTFVWTTVGDFTGMSYVLQISKERNFSSLVLDKKVSSHSEYTLTASETLNSGHYYWRMKGIDSNNNESQWSPISEFEVASMSTKVAILSAVTMVLIVAAIVFGILLAVANLRR